MVSEQVKINSERIDDIPVIMEWLKKMEIAKFIDQKLSPPRSFSVNHQQVDSPEESLLRYGYSKDFRPDLLQYRQLLATLDPMGMPLVCATLAGNGADDPLYFPTWQKMAQVIGHKKFIFIGDCKAGSIATKNKFSP
uniref:Transposase n=1 Tax=Nostoc flagelliforme str. Sunitezuoqi TaxID=676037 RepID=E7DPG2_9NOSO|nr:hypothetical protein Nfla_1103 [Nostoc flagelliforme str. Sunitezuoqi]